MDWICEITAHASKSFLVAAPTRKQALVALRNGEGFYIDSQYRERAFRVVGRAPKAKERKITTANKPQGKTKSDDFWCHHCRRWRSLVEREGYCGSCISQGYVNFVAA